MLRLFNFSRFQPLINTQFRTIANTRSAGGGTSWADYKRHQGRFGKDRTDADRLEYEREIKERTSRKLNWNIKNRWEQRALDDVVKNFDVREARFRDYTKISKNKMGTNI
jgi:hypothetical protein